MNSVLVVAMLLTVTLASAIAVLLVDVRRAPAIAVAASVGLAVAVPSFGPSNLLQVCSVGGTWVIVTCALFRKNPVDDKHWRLGNYFLLAYIVYNALIVANFASATAAAFEIFVALTVIEFALVAQRASFATPTYFPRMISVIIIVELVLGITEMFFELSAVWPRPDGSDRLENRPNHLIAILPGRVLGSLAGPIPYGAVGAIALLTCVWMVAKRRWIYLLPAGASAFVILMSGTRSAVLSVVVAVILWVCLSVVKKWRFMVIPFVVAAGLTFVALGYALLAGVFGFQETTSFTHRFSVITSIGQLFTRQDLVHIIFGSGDNARNILLNGIIASPDGVTVFDNQVIRSIAVTGVIGLVLLCAALARGLFIGNTLSRLVILAMMVLFFSFDELTWRSTLLIFVIACMGRVGVADHPGGWVRRGGPNFW